MVFLFSDVLIYARPNFLERKEICDRYSLQQSVEFDYNNIIIVFIVNFNRTYEFRCVFPLLNSTIQILHGDHRAPGIEALFQVRSKIVIVRISTSKSLLQHMHAYSFLMMIRP